MPNKKLDPEKMDLEADWEGNNAAFKCPCCGNIFIVSGFHHKNGRKCPNCNKSTAHCIGGKKSGGTASIEWKNGNEF